MADCPASGAGTVARNVVLDTGGTLAPGQASAGSVLTAASLTWNGGGTLELDLSASASRLDLSGALLKGASGAYRVIFHASTIPPIGTTFTLATFDRTDFSAADFSYAGLTDVGGAFALEQGALRFTITPLPGAAYCDACFTGHYPIEFRPGMVASLKRVVN